MSSTDVFPIRLDCNHRGHSELSYRSHFLAAKPKEMAWFAYDTIIHSRTDVEFVVYDMLDNVTGGVGKEIATFKTVVPNEITKDSVDRKIMLLAIDRREKEVRAAEEVIIFRYADEIRASI